MISTYNLVDRLRITTAIYSLHLRFSLDQGFLNGGIHTPWGYGTRSLGTGIYFIQSYLHLGRILDTGTGTGIYLEPRT